jgi:hypothetical protein
MTANLEKSAVVYDVGGSHVAAAVCFAGSYRLGRVVSVPHPAEETAQAFVSMLHALGVEASSGLGPVEGASLAFPGPFEYENGISRMTTSCLTSLAWICARRWRRVSAGCRPRSVF